MLVSLDGIHSGVPTRTTATLTPSTLRNIEQAYAELTSETPSTVPCQAGFVPPLAPFPFEQDQTSLCSTGSGSSGSWQTPPPNNIDEIGSSDANSVNSNKSNNNNNSNTSNNNSSKGTGTRRNMGGRRPNKPTNLTPEEEEKRKVRRERNKLAAARCRKRRVDHTNELMDEVEGLEKKKQNLQSDIQQLQQQKEELEFLLESHRAQCRLQARSQSPLDVKPHLNNILTLADKIKSEPLDLDGPPSPKRIMLSSTNPDVIIVPPVSVAATIVGTIQQTLTTPTTTTAMGRPISKPNRPSSLNVPLTITPSQAIAMNDKTIAEIAGIPITTPSNGMFNFDSLMDGRTGLTPVSAPLVPTCSLQNKHPLELAPPTSEPCKLVNL